MKFISISTAAIVVLLVAGLLLSRRSVTSTDAKEHRNSSGEAPEQQAGNERTAQWPKRLSALLEELEKPAADNNKLAMLFAKLSVAVHDQQTIDETLKVFKKAESDTKLPADARPYYAQLLLERSDSYPLQSADADSSRASAQRALDLFLQAYSEEAGKDTVDGRKLADIGLRVVRLYERFDREDEANQWLASMLTLPTLPASTRAQIAYTLGVQYWKKSYDLTADYSNHDQPVPEADVPRVREWVNQAYSYLNTAHSLDSKHANAWFYKKLVALQEAAIEKDRQQKMVIQKKAAEAQDRFTALTEEQRRSKVTGDTDSRDDTKPYASGLPSLNFSSITLIAPPPPPPPPPPPRPRRGKP